MDKEKVLCEDRQPGEPGDYDNHRLTEAIELFFFAYRDFTSDPDEILETYGFGRAHHRVMHFVGRHPGITVAELLNILRITKQSLARVLKELIERGLVRQEEGARDRRQRLLFLTQAGVDLGREVDVPQRERVRQALEAAGPEAVDMWRRVLIQLVNADDREIVTALVDRHRASTSSEGGE